MRTWRMAMRVGTGGVSMWSKCREKGIAAITYLPVSRTDLTPYSDTASPDGWGQMEIPQRTSLKRFAWGIKGGDIIFVKEGPQLIGRGIVKGEIGLRAYEYRPDLGLIDPNGTPWPHIVPVEWDDTFEPITIQVGNAQISTVEELDDLDLANIAKAQDEQSIDSGIRNIAGNGIPSLDVVIPDFQHKKHNPFNIGERPDFYTPQELLEKSESQTLRMDFFIKHLVAIYWATGEPVPYVFRTRDGKIRSLDAGCLGSLAHRNPPDVSFELDAQGTIIAVRPEKRRLDLYDVLRPALLRAIGVGDLTAPQSSVPAQDTDRSLKTSEIVEVLEGRGFSTSSTMKIMRFEHPRLDHPVYVKIPAPERDRVRNPFVMHPDWPYIRPGILEISGLTLDQNWYHLSNMTDFPMRVHGGATPTHYGLAANFDSESSLHSLLDLVLGTGNLAPFLASSNPAVVSDLEAAKSDLDLAETVTERTSLVKARIGQGKFREDLISFWGGCAVTVVKSHSLLKASHIKPWRHGSNAERLDKFNGLLLTPNLDHAFDVGLISFRDDGSIIISPTLNHEEANALGVTSGLRLKQIQPAHRPYLEWHRQHEFKV